MSVQEFFEVITDTLHERLSEAHRESPMLVPQILEQIVEVVQERVPKRFFLSRSGIYRSQIGEETVEVVWIILLERVQQCSVEQLADVFGRTSASPHERISEILCAQTERSKFDEVSSSSPKYQCFSFSHEFPLRSEFLKRFCEQTAYVRFLSCRAAHLGPNCSELSKQFRCFLCRRWWNRLCKFADCGLFVPHDIGKCEVPYLKGLVEAVRLIPPAVSLSCDINRPGGHRSSTKFFFDERLHSVFPFF